jgi:hypothetical protein
MLKKVWNGAVTSEDVREAEGRINSSKLTKGSLAVLIARLAYEAGCSNIARDALRLAAQEPSVYLYGDGGVDPFADDPDPLRRADGHRSVDDVLAKRTRKKR